MTINFYAVGWQAAQRDQIVGQVKNFRKAYLTKGKDDFLKHLQFANNLTGKETLLRKKFEDAISTLENVETNGNNTEVPFFRTVTKELSIEDERISKISTQLQQQLPALKQLEKIRFYIITEEIGGITYRYYIKALRTAKLNTRFILTATAGQLTITDTENNGKALPYVICYAEKIDSTKILQYVFSVQDYEDIFGLNESKIRTAKANFEKFFSQEDGKPAEYKISGEYVIKVDPAEHSLIHQKIETNRKLANLLSKYNGEAVDLEWEDVKEANKLAQDFMQTPFNYDEDTHVIELTAESLDAWVSVISNTKKLGVAKHEYEDSLAPRRASKNT